MAKIKDGIFGGFSGRIGNVVGVFRGGKYYIKSRPASVANPRTKKQQANRSKFGLAAQLNSVINPFIQQGFKTVGGSAWGAAMSAVSQSAIRGEEPDFYIDYQYVKVAAGMLMPPKVPTVQFDASDNPLFEWEDNSGEGNAKAGDRAMLLAIDADQMQCVYTLKGAERSAGQDVIENIPNSFKEGELYGYMAFMSADESMVSDSVFVPLG